MQEHQNQEENSQEVNKDQEEQQPEQHGCGCSQIKFEREEYKQNWQRALADYQNLQKETAARRSELVSMSEQQILEEFIPVYDNFKSAFRSKDRLEWNKEQNNWVIGIQYIMKQFGDVLKAHNVEEIKTAGEKFDPKMHEAVSEEENQDVKNGMIVREAEGGYVMGGRVIKTAKVVIAK
jgi:molecular chaperone GrpE